MTKIQEVLKDRELELFLKKMREMDGKFCEAMANKKAELTIRLELRVAKGQLMHARLYEDNLEKPKDKG